MRIVYDNGIHIRNIHATFYNIRTYQHIIFPVYKVKDLLFQLVAFHLSVRIRYTQVRTLCLYHSSHFRQALYTVMNKEYLSATFRFVIDGITDKLYIKYLYFGLYRLPVWWW